MNYRDLGKVYFFSLKCQSKEILKIVNIPVSRLADCNQVKEYTKNLCNCNLKEFSLECFLTDLHIYNLLPAFSTCISCKVKRLCVNPLHCIVKINSRLVQINRNLKYSFTGWQPAHLEAWMLNVCPIYHPV